MEWNVDEKLLVVDDEQRAVSGVKSCLAVDERNIQFRCSKAIKMKNAKIKGSKVI